MDERFQLILDGQAITPTELDFRVIVEGYEAGEDATWVRLEPPLSALLLVAQWAECWLKVRIPSSAVGLSFGNPDEVSEFSAECASPTEPWRALELTECECSRDLAGVFHLTLRGPALVLEFDGVARLIEVGIVSREGRQRADAFLSTMIGPTDVEHAVTEHQQGDGEQQLLLVRWVPEFVRQAREAAFEAQRAQRAPCGDVDSSDFD